VCLLSDSDAWTRQVLAPLVESAGYCVLFQDDGSADGKPDLMILSEGADARPYDAATVVRLRPTADERGASGESLWRYDRVGLTAELRRHWNKRSSS